MYNLLAEQYSKLFPPDEKRCSFVLEEISSPAESSVPAALKILDAGCATGDLSFELAAAGAAVTGIDLDADMIRIAVQKAAEPGQSSLNEVPAFLCRSMTELKDLGVFNAVICFGNTLPHLPSAELVKEFFAQAADLLNPGGKLIFQIINFDHLPRVGDYDFPDINTVETIFKRSYSNRADGRIDFNISLTDLISKKNVSDSTPLLPLSGTELTHFLSESGYNEIKAYTGYDRIPADGKEFATIYCASV